MTLILTAIHVLACLALVFVVLLQKNGGDMGAAFGGSSQSLFGARGSGSFLGKLTAVLATTFMITSLALAFFTTQGTRQGSLMEGKAAQSAPSPAANPAGDLPLPAKAGPATSEENAPAATGSKPIPLPDAPPPPAEADSGNSPEPKGDPEQKTPPSP